jgi:hypothetical protein
MHAMNIHIGNKSKNRTNKVSVVSILCEKGKSILRVQIGVCWINTIREPRRIGPQLQTK